MKATVTNAGQLHLTAENPAEAALLRSWFHNTMPGHPQAPTACVLSNHYIPEGQSAYVQFTMLSHPVGV